MDQTEGDRLGGLLQAGKCEAFAELIRHYRVRVFNIARHITGSHDDAEDVAQETFLQMLEKIGQWRGENFDGWLSRIAQNRAIDCLRRRGGELEPRAQQERCLPDEEIIGREQRDAVNRILERLPRAQREILYLRHFEGCPIREIARRRKCAEGTIKATLYQIFQKLKKEFTVAGLME